MEPQFLRQLAEVVDLGSLSLAAKSLSLSQPTLSRNIKSIEASIGAPVVRRGRYGVTPTVIGEILAKEGRAIRGAMRQAEADVANWRNGLDGRLHIGVGTMLAQALLPSFLSADDVQAWRIALQIDVESADRLLDRVRERLLDLAVIEFGRVFSGEGLTQIALLEDRRAFYAAESHPLSRMDSVSPGDLARAQRVNVGSFAKDIDLVPIPIMAARGPMIEVSGDAAIALNLLLTGRYVALLPEFVMQTLPERHRFRRLNYNGRLPSRTLSIFHRSDMMGHPLIKTFSGRFRRFVRDLQDSHALHSEEVEA